MRTELPSGAHVSGTAPSCITCCRDFTASPFAAPAHASSIAFSACQGTTPLSRCRCMSASCKEEFGHSFAVICACAAQMCFAP